jgi:hypothetical protein
LIYITFKNPITLYIETTIVNDSSVTIKNDENGSSPRTVTDEPEGLTTKLRKLTIINNALANGSNEHAVPRGHDRSYQNKGWPVHRR